MAPIYGQVILATVLHHPYGVSSVSIEKISGEYVHTVRARAFSRLTVLFVLMITLVTLPADVDILAESDNPTHYADAIRYNARTPLQGSLLPLTRLV